MLVITPPQTCGLVEILAMAEDEMLEEIKSKSPSSELELISYLRFSPFAQTSLANLVGRNWRKLNPMLHESTLLDLIPSNPQLQPIHLSHLVAKEYGLLRRASKELRSYWYFTAKGHAHFMR